MVDIRNNENKRESWYIKNISSGNINIGDLPSIPTLKSGESTDLLKYYTREKVSHSTVLVNLVKRGILTLSKDKNFSNDLPGPITIAKIDEAITPAEENELLRIEDIDHNDLQGLQGGDPSNNEFFHVPEWFTDATLTIELTTEVGDPGTDDKVVTEQGIREALDDIEHNELQGLQVVGGVDPSNNDYYHLSSPGDLIDEIITGEEITDSTGGILLHGKDNEDTAQPVGISGEENDEIEIMDLDTETLLEDIYLELIKANIQMSIITGNEIKNKDISLANN